MSDRFNPGPLLAAAFGAVRHRSAVGTERVDWVGLTILMGLPALVGLGSWWPLGVAIRVPDPLVAGVALLAAALLAAFAQLAMWRARLTDRARTSERVNRSAIDEAVAHTLVSSAIALLTAVLLAILSNMLPAGSAPPSAGILAAIQVLSSVAIGLGAFLVVDFLLIANLLWDTYESANSTSGAGSTVVLERRNGTQG